MAGFPDLSNELVLMIADFVEVEDFYNFCTLSKKIYLLTRELLREHCKLKHEFSTISNIGGMSGTFGRILKAILLNPQVAPYPSLLKIESWEYEWQQSGSYSQEKVPESDLGLFKQAVRDTVDVSEESMNECWFAAIDAGDEEPLIALLLLLLPNLRQVQLGTCVNFSFCLLETLMMIADERYSCSLKKLRSVDLECMPTSASRDYFMNFEYVRYFAALPSVTSIHGYIVSNEQDDVLETSTWNVGTGTTNVTSLSFVKCALDPKSLSEFLSTTWNLQRFFYTPVQLHGYTAEFDPFWIRTALLHNARDTLKVLTILPDGQERLFMGSLTKFTCLECVQSDYRLLIGDPAASLNKLSDVLPPSIVNLTIHINHLFDDGYSDATIEDIAKHPVYFEFLKRITIVGVPDVEAAKSSHENLFLELKERGTELSFMAEQCIA